MFDPTAKQIAILKFIDKYKKENDETPSIREMCKEFKISTKGIADHLTALQKKGMIERIPRQRRIKILNRMWIDDK